VTEHDDWWRRAVLYQVYPRSFADSNGDGVGDLPGIIGSLDYLVELGVVAIWLSPFYASPMVDFGYDITDHTAVDPAFGTLADFDALLAAAHTRGLRVLVDFVPNHTSDQHPWFLDSRSGRDSPRRDWYVWADPGPHGGPPNNWLSTFRATGAAWTLDAATGQYYLHLPPEGANRLPSDHVLARLVEDFGPDVLPATIGHSATVRRMALAMRCLSSAAHRAEGSASHGLDRGCA